jgi:hypothetical protein
VKTAVDRELSRSEEDTNKQGNTSTKGVYAKCVRVNARRTRERIWYPNTPLQIDTSPRAMAKCLTLGDGKALVKTSATMSSVGQ